MTRQMSQWTIWLPLALAIMVGLAAAFLPQNALIAAGSLALLAVVVLVIFVQPLVGLALALLAGPWGALENVVFASALPIDSGQGLLLITIAAWLGRGLARRRVFVPRVPLIWPIVIFGGVMLLTLIGAPSPVLGGIELLKWIEIVLIMILIVDLATEDQPDGQQQLTPQVIKVSAALLMMVLAAGLSQALIGIWQFGLRGDGPEHFLVLGRFYRAYGTFEQPNPFGGFMELNVALALGVMIGFGTALWCNGRPNSRRSLLVITLLLAVCSAILGSALLMSWSRGAWIGLAAALLGLLLFWPRRFWVGIGLAITAGLFLILVWQADLVPAAVTGRVETIIADYRPGDVRGVDINDSNYSVLERLAFWQAALAMAADHPWLGVGFGNYAIAYEDYALINWTTSLGHAHNYYFNQLAETGAIGLGAYLIMWICIGAHCIWLLYRLPWPQRGVALGLLAAWIAFAVHHLVDKLYVNNIYVHIGAMLGLQALLVIHIQQHVKRPTDHHQIEV